MTPVTASRLPWTPRPEPELVPYRPLGPLAIDSLLVLAPHPDDEVFGCGGLLALAARQGVRVQVVVLSDGAAGGDAQERERECRAAADTLGYLQHADALQFWRLPDRGLQPDDALVQRLQALLADTRPDWLLAPSPFEIHPDHRAVCEAAIAAVATSAARLVFYEVGQPLMPNGLVDITPVQALKQQAMRCFGSQLAAQDYAGQISALNHYRAYTLGPAVSHAEALYFVDDLPTGGGREAALASLRPRWGLDVPAPVPAADPTVEALRRRLAAAETAYAALEAGYLQLTRSLSWRVTAPLRALRGGLGAQGRREGARRLARWLARPLSPALRRQVKATLAARSSTAALLQWLLPPAAVAVEPTAAAGAAEAGLDKEAIRAEAEAALGRWLGSGERLVFERPAEPRVSVIVVLYNQAGLSHLCLQALHAVREPGFELILVDNASSDRMPELLARIDGALLLRQDQNLGFLRAVNLAAAQARGEHLLLLNNDALVFPDTLQRAVQRLAREPDAGAVGGPILWWDGRLQEAGSLIWRDGACLGYGRGDSPDAGPYRFVRDVDYCSGALLMVRRPLFEALGGFDEAYAPAYYEESDLCVRLWQAGHRVVYDPAVRVRHFEFASDQGSGQALALQARNRLHFEAKHRGFLQQRPEASPAAVLAARQRLRPGTPRVLVIDDRVPLPSLGRGYPRAARLTQALVLAGAFVTFYPLVFPHEDWQAVYEALPERVEVIQGLGLAGLAAFLTERAGGHDLLLVSRPHNMEVVQAIRRQHPRAFAGVRLVYDAEALFSLRDIQRAAVLSTPLPAEEQRRLVADEMRLARGVHAILTVSEREARHFREAGHQQVHVLGHALQAEPGSPGFAPRNGFLFVGALEADNSPNTDSLLWFLREVWPRVREALGPAAWLDLVGPCESLSVPALADERVRLHGRVASVRDFYDRARVFIVPTRFAAGLPHKAHEAAAHGLPMVVSPLIADQLGWQDAALPVADGAAAFAEACIALHQDPLRWQSARDHGLAAVRHDCDAATFDATVRRLLETTLAGPTRLRTAA